MDIRVAGNVLIQKIPGLGVDKIPLIWKRGRHATGNIAEDLRLAEDRLAGQTAPHIRIDRMGNIASRPIRLETHPRDIDLGLSTLRNGKSGCTAELRYAYDLRQFVPPMPGLAD